MIRIHRPTEEPPALAHVRAKRLPAARAAFAAGEEISYEGYAVAKPDLSDMQRRKCCYCEKREEQAKYRDVEHYRPKARYWWLAWTWDNLLFSCVDCNREFKREQFPLTPGDVALAPEHSPPGSEQPLIIDPSDPSINPMDEIVFRRVRINGVDEWVPSGKTERGQKTVEICGLNRPALRDLYRYHVTGYVRPRAANVMKAHREQGTREVVTEWDRANRALLNPTQPFCGLSHDALLVLVPEKVRERHQLTLTRP